MKFVTAIENVRKNLPAYALSEGATEALAEYLPFLLSREDLLARAEDYYTGLYETGAYTLGEAEGFPEGDGREEGLLFACLHLARYEILDEIFAARGIPESYKTSALNSLRGNIEKTKTQKGSYGLQGKYRSAVYQYLVPTEYVLGRLIFQITKFDSCYEVYRSKTDGKTVKVALPGFRYMEDGKRPPEDYTGKIFEPTLEITEGILHGYTYDAHGCMMQTPVKLDLADYDKVLAGGDDVLSVHIPAKGRMTPESVDDAFSLADDFFAKYYPDKDFKAYVCSSWLLNTDMRHWLKPESNIQLFRNRFDVVITSRNGYSLSWHVFGLEDITPVEQLQPTNSFQQSVVDWVKAGNTLYNGYGYILKK